MEILKDIVLVITPLAVGVLGGQLFVHLMEHETKGVKYSYLRYAITILSILAMIWLYIKAGGFQDNESLFDSLFLFSIIASFIITVITLYKKKGMHYRDGYSKKG